ncbi:MAG: HEAT repeat domain-containing protein [Caldilineales bacterium]|nr:HEAT repeat domain-containing protein [Caldilineales bacterium]MDW8317512.1 HEAT repeat domain-containing protein [Anaerolineae bacterium]
MNWLDRLRAWLAGLGTPPDADGPRLSAAQQAELLQGLQSGRPGHRWLAAEGLGVRNLGGKGVKALAQALADPDPMLRWEAAAALARSGSGAARQALLAALSGADPQAQAAAADALGLLPPQPEALALLVQALGSPHSVVRQSAAEALARWSPPPVEKAQPAPPDVETPLLGLLSDPEPAVRRAAALALGRWGGQAAREALERLAADGEQIPWVREAVAQALRRLPQPVVAPLAEVAEPAGPDAEESAQDEPSAAEPLKEA